MFLGDGALERLDGAEDGLVHHPPVRARHANQVGRLRIFGCPFRKDVRRIPLLVLILFVSEVLPGEGVDLFVGELLKHNLQHHAVRQVVRRRRGRGARPGDSLHTLHARSRCGQGLARGEDGVVCERCGAE